MHPSGRPPPVFILVPSRLDLRDSSSCQKSATTPSSPTTNKFVFHPSNLLTFAITSCRPLRRIPHGAHQCFHLPRLFFKLFNLPHESCEHSSGLSSGTFFVLLVLFPSSNCSKTRFAVPPDRGLLAAMCHVRLSFTR